jgi:hypothetical protein
MPKGFNRLGLVEKMSLDIFESIEEKNEQWGTFDHFNIPTWKYLDGFGNTLVRGHSPRTNGTFTMVILGDCRKDINCFEVTNEIMGLSMCKTWSNMLSSQYSVMEMDQLFHIMSRIEEEDFERHKKESLRNSYHGPGVVGLVGAYGVRYRVAHLDDDPTVKEPIENMPLYINDENIVKRAIAIFRLQVGK